MNIQIITKLTKNAIIINDDKSTLIPPHYFSDLLIITVTIIRIKIYTAVNMMTG